jgi:hypothetical protein
MKLFALLGIFAWTLSGQVSSGALYGTATDPSGKPVQGVQMEARQQTTGFVRTTSTNEAGEYLFDQLLPDSYTVSAKHPDFQTFVASDALVEINAKTRLNFQLSLGPRQESVTVEAHASLVDGDDSTEGYRIDSGTLSNLPLDERNIISIVTVAPGAIPRQLGGFVHDVDNDVQAGTRGAVALNAPVNGSRPYMNRYILDGGSDTDGNVFAIGVIPPMEAVQEFRIQSSLATAPFMQAGGGVVDIVTKSGGNQFHGSVFEFLRNQVTDAENYFDDPSLPGAVFRRNQFGGALGGPLAKSTFFFATYEGLNDTSATSTVQLLPDAAYRTGNFAGDSVIYDPLSLNPATGTRTPFANNVIPVSRLDPIAQKYLAEFEPFPNLANNPNGNYVDDTPSTQSNNSGSIRIDHQFNAANLLFARYTINNENGGIAGNFPLRPTAESLRAQQAVIGYTAAGSNWTNDARLSFLRLRLFDLPVNAGGQNIEQQLGILGAPTDPLAFGLPYFLVTDFATVTDDPTLPQTQRDNTWQLSDTVSMTRGRHTWKFGLDFEYFQFNYLQSNSIRGQYIYTGAFTQNNSDPTTGEAFADFLLGDPQQTTRTVGAAQAYLRQHNYAAFLQHEWQVTSRLTVNVGARYEFFSPFSDARNQLLNLDYGTLPKDPALVPVSQATAPNRLNLAPRFALAWRLPDALGGKYDTVFRAGYGIYYTPEIAVEAYDLVLNNQSTVLNTVSGTALPVLTTSNGFPNVAGVGEPSYFGVDTHAPTPYVQQWNATLQSALPHEVLVEAAYVGSKGTNLGLFRRFNTALQTETGADLSPRPGDLQSLRSFPDLGTLFQRQHIGNSSYNSLQLKVEKRMRKSLSFLASYVWSKSLDDADSELVSLYDSVGAQDENNLHQERGLSFFNVPRRVSAAVVYNLPNIRTLRWLTNGWGVSSVVTLQDGTPLDPVYYSADFANTGTPNRPDLVPGQSISLPASERTPERWFNTAAFTAPAPYTFGNAGRNIIPGPGNEVVDLALHRRFSITERVGLDFRAEAFNSLNHPNIGIPLTYPDFGSLFGKIFGAGDPRRIQFAARLEF